MSDLDFYFSALRCGCEETLEQRHYMEEQARKRREKRLEDLKKKESGSRNEQVIGK